MTALLSFSSPVSAAHPCLGYWALPFRIQDSRGFHQVNKPSSRQDSHQDESTYKGTLCRAPRWALTSFSRWSSRTFGAWWQPWGPARAASPGWNTWAHNPGSPGHHGDFVLWEVTKGQGVSSNQNCFGNHIALEVNTEQNNHPSLFSGRFL